MPAGFHQDASSETPVPTATSPEESDQPYLLIAAWSAASVALACRLTLPSLLAPGNLGSLDREDRKVPATILCLRADRAQYEDSAAFRAFCHDRLVDWYALDAHVELLDEAREVIASEAFRAVMAGQQQSGAARSFLLVKGGHVFADGALTRAAHLLAGGASAVMAPVPMVSAEMLVRQVDGSVDGDGSSLRPRSLARAAVLDAAAAASRLHEYGGMLGFAPGGDDAVAGAFNRRLRTARLHPVGLRPEYEVDPARESLLDAEIVPEFVAAERGVHRAASSDEILILDARSPQVLLQDVAAHPAPVADQIAAWATPWHLSNLASPYHLIGSNEGAMPAAGVAPPLPAGPGIPADRHPAWLAARGLQTIPAILGRERRYMSLLDGRYRAARLAVEAVEAGAAVYAGPAETTFAPLLRRHFARAMIGNVPQTLLAARQRDRARIDLLHVIHVELQILPPLVGELTEAVHALSLDRCPIIILVEAHDHLGGIPVADLGDLREWCQDIARAAERAGATADLAPTASGFFDGHQGFLIAVTPQIDGSVRTESLDRTDGPDRAPVLAREVLR